MGEPAGHVGERAVVGGGRMQERQRVAHDVGGSAEREEADALRHHTRQETGGPPGDKSTLLEFYSATVLDFYLATVLP